jgi:hypothetical protein
MSAWYLHAWVGSGYLVNGWKSAGIIALCILAGLLALALWAACVWAAWIYLRRKQQVVFPLVISSRSNVYTNYQMRVEMGGLEKFVQAFWEQDGERLSPSILKQYSYEQEPLPEPVAATTGKRSGKIGLPDKEKKKAQEGVKKVNLITSLVANISGVLAGLLPGSMKTPFREVNTAIREQQQKVSGVKADVSHVQSSTRSLNTDVRRLGDATGVKPGGGNGGGAGGKTAEVGQRLVVNEIPVTDTRVLEPGQSDLCNLVVSPVNPLRNLEGDLRVITQPLEIKEFPLYGSLPVQTLSANVKIKSEVLQRVLFAGLVLVSGALCIWGASALVSWLWLFRM